MHNPKREDRTLIQPALGRLDGIDTLRGVSILAVILLHIRIRMSFGHVRLGGDWPHMLSSLVWSNGGNGVTIFFAVSGFLITLTSLRRFGSLQQLKPRVFYRIRFARIMPLLLLLLAVLSILHAAHVEGFVVNPKFFTLPRALVSALTFHLNWLEASRNAWLPACWTVLWSLSIEEMFYLFFPLAAVLLARRARTVPWLWLALAVTLVVLGPFARTVWSHTDLQLENSYLAGMSDIAMGCIAAWGTHRWLRSGSRPRPGALAVLQLVGWLPVLAFATWPPWHWLRPAMRRLAKSGTDDTALAAAASLLCLCAVFAVRGGRSWTSPLRWFGRHSYELYLSHEFVVMAGVALFASRFPRGASRGVIAAFVVTIVALTAPLGWVLAKYFSEPMNRRLRGARPAP